MIIDAQCLALNESGDVLIEWDYNNPEDVAEKLKYYELLKQRGYNIYWPRPANRLPGRCRRGLPMPSFAVEAESMIVGELNIVHVIDTTLEYDRLLIPIGTRKAICQLDMWHEEGSHTTPEDDTWEYDNLMNPRATTSIQEALK